MKKLLSASFGIALVTVMLALTPAHAAAGDDEVTPMGPATGSEDVGDQYGSVIRARFHQKVDKSGYTWDTYGSGDCSPGTNGYDFAKSEMYKDNWNDVVSYVQDANRCDVKLFRHADFGDAMTGYHHYNTDGESFSGRWINNRTSSYMVS